jgi:hypothetical protein
VRLIVWCRGCQHQVEPDPAEHAGSTAPAFTEWLWVIHDLLSL